MSRLFALLSLLGLSGTPAPAQAVPDLGLHLTGQQALYTLSLSKLRTENITGATGQMSFNVADGCTGWGTTQHMILIVRNADGTLTKTVSDYVTWERKDGKSLSFLLTERDNDGKLQIDDAGIARHTGADGSGEVDYTTPANTRLRLPPGTLFPMQHTAALLAAGRDGQKFIAPPLFDGTDTDGAEATFVAELGHLPPGHAPDPALANIASSNVDIAFFDRKTDDETPQFRTQMRYFEDGVATDLVLDFGDFVMNAKLDKLTIPPSPCKG
jgi:hypothetical protein